MNPMNIVLAIGGWDPTSGAGISADIKAIHGAGAYAVTAITGLVVQTPSKVLSVHVVPPAVVRETLQTALAGFKIGAVKTGMLGSPASPKKYFSSSANHPSPGSSIRSARHLTERRSAPGR